MALTQVTYSAIIPCLKPSGSIAVAATTDADEQLANNEEHEFFASSQILLLAAEQGHWYKEQPFS